MQFLLLLIFLVLFLKLLESITKYQIEKAKIKEKQKINILIDNVKKLILTIEKNYPLLNEDTEFQLLKEKLNSFTSESELNDVNKVLEKIIKFLGKYKIFNVKIS